uniref:DNA2/NAM7 helicase-like C-terminal domain-containing protein n=1 Tax=Panagrolaimus davidi TaxID=227884 RepID=A0A914PS09_9BILA
MAVAQRKIERRMLNVRLLDQHPREWLRERTQLKDIVQAARERKWNYLRKLMLLPDDRWNRKLTEWTPNTRRFDANTAAEILISCQNNMQVVNREIALARNFIGNRKPVASKLPETNAAAAEELTDLDFEADDDNNRIIVDNNFMNEFFGDKKKKTKKDKHNISQTLMPHFYEDLHDDPSVLQRKPVKGVTKNLMFITHSQPEISEKDIKSHSNPFEAKFALKLAKYFLQQGYKGSQITVLCTYLDQLLSLRKAAPNVIGEREKITIESVDNYQGEESDIIILSLVRSNNPEGKIGFLNIPNRVCVALSRAKEGLFVICNMDFLAKKSEMWKKIQKSVEEVDAIDTALTVKCKMHQKEQVSFELSGISTTKI